MALTLSRAAGESIVLADRLQITVDEIDGHQVSVLLGDLDGAPQARHTFTGPDAELRLGDHVRIHGRVDAARPWQARLSISAPPTVRVMRRELMPAAAAHA